MTGRRTKLWQPLQAPWQSQCSGSLCPGPGRGAPSRPGPWRRRHLGGAAPLLLLAQVLQERRVCPKEVVPEDEHRRVDPHVVRMVEVVAVRGRQERQEPDWAPGEGEPGVLLDADENPQQSPHEHREEVRAQEERPGDDWAEIANDELNRVGMLRGETGNGRVLVVPLVHVAGGGDGRQVECTFQQSIPLRGRCLPAERG